MFNVSYRHPHDAFHSETGELQLGAQQASGRQLYAAFTLWFGS